MSTGKPLYPFNFRIGFFCVLMGAVLSVPTGMLRAQILSYATPDVLKRFYLTTVSGCYFLLPIWSLVVWRYQPLPILGIITFLLCFRFLFPEMS